MCGSNLHSRAVMCLFLSMWGGVCEAVETESVLRVESTRLLWWSLLVWVHGVTSVSSCIQTCTYFQRPPEYFIWTTCVNVVYPDFNLSVHCVLFSFWFECIEWTFSEAVFTHAHSFKKSPEFFIRAAYVNTKVQMLSRMSPSELCSLPMFFPSSDWISDCLT